MSFHFILVFVFIFLLRNGKPHRLRVTVTLTHLEEQLFWTAEQRMIRVNLGLSLETGQGIFYRNILQIYNM